MRRDLGEDVLFNTVMMMRMRNCRTVIVTESEADAAFYQKFVSDKDCFIGFAEGRHGVLSVLNRFSSYRLAACGGIIDADADYVWSRPRPSPNICRTDKTDKETTIIDSPAFDRFCSTLSSRVAAATLRELIYEAAHPLGAIRRQAARLGLGVDFKKILCGNFISSGPICDASQCCCEVKSLNQHIDISLEQLMDFIQDPALNSFPKPQIVQGHDMTAILALQSPQLFGRSISQAEIEFELGRAYLASHFHATAMYRDLIEWERSIAPSYRIFP